MLLPPCGHLYCQVVIGMPAKPESKGLAHLLELALWLFGGCLIINVCIHSKFLLSVWVCNIIIGGEDERKRAHGPHLLPRVTGYWHLSKNLQLGTIKVAEGFQQIFLKMKLTKMIEVFHTPHPQKDPLQKGMTTPSSVLAWRIPWTAEPGGVQSMELQRVGHHLEINSSHPGSIWL